MQANINQTSNRVEGLRSVFVNKDTSVVEDVEVITEKPQALSEELFREGFATIFGNSELPIGEPDLFPEALIELASIAFGS